MLSLSLRYSRTPAGGPLRGGTRLTISGEGMEGYGKTLDYINQMLIDENLITMSNIWCMPYARGLSLAAPRHAAV